ncbi:Amine oxidase [Psidium guajava]|nr:Amine oxidase [Psidium guajava]
MPAATGPPPPSGTVQTPSTAPPPRTLLRGPTPSGSSSFFLFDPSLSSVPALFLCYSSIIHGCGLQLQLHQSKAFVVDLVRPWTGFEARRQNSRP